jgi:hypothetical protein
LGFLSSQRWEWQITTRCSRARRKFAMGRGGFSSVAQACISLLKFLPKIDLPPSSSRVASRNVPEFR